MLAALGEIWERATTAQPTLSAPVVLLLGGLALALSWAPAGYQVLRHLVTLIHEAGHAVVAVLTGRQLRGVRLHSDTSGVTVSRGRPRGPGMILTLVAGYPAPCLVGVGGAALVGSGYAAGWLWALVLCCALMLLLVRNLYGLWVVLVTGLVVAGLSWWGSAALLTGVGTLLTWCLLLAAPRSVVELQLQRRRGRGRDSDVDQLAGLTHLPAVLWVAAFWMVGALAVLAGAVLLLR